MFLLQVLSKKASVTRCFSIELVDAQAYPPYKNTNRVGWGKTRAQRAPHPSTPISHNHKKANQRSRRVDKPKRIHVARRWQTILNKYLWTLLSDYAVRNLAANPT